MSSLALPVKIDAFSGSRRPPGQARGVSPVSPWDAIQNQVYTMRNEAMVLIFMTCLRAGAFYSGQQWAGAGMTAEN
jgi:hypothetical protein